MKCAAYVRNSSLGQAERQTTAQQLEFLQQWAAMHGHRIVETYEEEATSGRTPMVQRPVGRRMLADAKARRFEALVVYRLDRFGRSTADTLSTLAELQKLGVRFISASEGFGEGPNGMMFLTFASAMAERERALIEQRTIGGKQQAARKGRHTGGPVPWGYEVGPDGKLALSADAPLVCQVFERVAGGESVSSVCRDLASRDGRPWHVARLTRMIASPMYKGTYPVAFKTGTIIQETPAIVSVDLWDRANEAIKTRAWRPRGQLHLLQGVLTCGSCGRAFCAQRRTSGPREYRCQGQAHKNGCKAKLLRADPLEEWAWGMIVELFQSDDGGHSPYETLINEAEADDLRALEADRDDPEALRQEQARLRQAHTNLIEALEAGHVTYAAIAPS
jgi:site-specific DNA recombinase